MDEPHVRAQHVVALLLQQARGDGGIDATGHRDEHGRHVRRLSATPRRSRRRETRTRDRIVSRMLEARFDDLTGASPSFRLVEPVGVLEATRAGEVVATSTRPRRRPGAAFGSRGSSPTRPRPASTRLSSSARATPTIRSRPCPSPGSRCSSAPRRPRCRSLATRRASPRPPKEPWVPTTTRERYESSVDRIRELIAAGETYQVNHTMRLRSHVEGDPRGLYRDLSYAQRCAFSAYLDLGRYRVLSASPELFFELRDGAIVTKPMKGTAPRGRWPDEDRAVAEHLLASAKDRAENAMIVDLLRNDLGRISRTGSVTWADVFQTERYETVWQLTTTVSAELEAGVGLADVFRGLFPSGSVTGAPKVRTMEIVGELEDSPRGIYCGAIGYLAPHGIRLPERAIQCRDPHGHPRHRLAHRRVRRRRRHHVGLRGGRRVRGGSGEDPRPHGTSSRLRAPGDDAVRPRRRCETPGHASPAPGRVRRLLRVPIRRDRRPRSRGEDGRLRAARTVPRPPRPRQRRHGTGGVHAARERAGRRPRLAR